MHKTGISMGLAAGLAAAVDVGGHMGDDLGLQRRDRPAELLDAGTKFLTSLLANRR